MRERERERKRDKEREREKRKDRGPSPVHSMRREGERERDGSGGRTEGLAQYGSWPKPLPVPLPVQNLVRRLSATPGETEGSQEPWPRLSGCGADFGQFLDHFDSTCQTGDARLHTVAARARLYALGKCLEDSLLDSYKGHLLRADKKGTLHHSPDSHS